MHISAVLSAVELVSYRGSAGLGCCLAPLRLGVVPQLPNENTQTTHVHPHGRLMVVWVRTQSVQYMQSSGRLWAKGPGIAHHGTECEDECEPAYKVTARPGRYAGLKSERQVGSTLRWGRACLLFVPPALTSEGCRWTPHWRACCGTLKSPKRPAGGAQGPLAPPQANLWLCHARHWITTPNPRNIGIRIRIRICLRLGGASGMLKGACNFDPAWALDQVWPIGYEL